MATVDHRAAVATREIDDESRCAICGWPLVGPNRHGCWRGNCSQRPLPDTAYALARAAREYGPSLDVTRFTNHLFRVPAETAPHDWQPIATCPREVTRALLYWPAFELGADGNLTDQLAGEGLVSLAYRDVNGGWEELDSALEATGAEFGDDWEYGEPTHWMLLPAPPPPDEPPAVPAVAVSADGSQAAPCASNRSSSEPSTPGGTF